VFFLRDECCLYITWVLLVSFLPQRKVLGGESYSLASIRVPQNWLGFMFSTIGKGYFKLVFWVYNEPFVRSSMRFFRFW
jgi:hypothetical protein